MAWHSLTSKALLALLLPVLDARVLPQGPTLGGSSLVTRDTNAANADAHILLSAPPTSASVIDRTGWTVTCDSVQTGNECAKAIDGDTNTFWLTKSSTTPDKLPHSIVIDMKSNKNVNGIAVLPRQDGSTAGFIAQHAVYLSTDGTNFGSPVAFGTWWADKIEKFANFETKPARYIKIVAITEASGSALTSVSNINAYQAASYTAPPNGLGSWGPTIDFPLVPVAAAVEPNTGKILTWSSYSNDQFTNTPGGVTLTSTYDPVAQTISQRKVTNTGHDMFCPGISVDANGRVVVTGGNDAAKTSIYDFSSDSWIPGANMNIPRGYQSSTICSDGRIFTLGGSWSGGVGGKKGEIYSPSTNKWTVLPQCPVEPIFTNDPEGVYKQDNHAWLFGWKKGTVFQAGPSKQMNWYTTSGTGGVLGAGNRGTDDHAMCGTAVMYDAPAGKILAAGGAPAYTNSDATSNGNIITLGNPNATVATAKTGNVMNFRRVFHNAIILPNGETFIIGGQTYAKGFTDEKAVFTPEIYSPTTNQFRTALTNTIPRVYHSVALLLPDATVFTAGGGLCGTCSANHLDAQVYTPQYLLTSTGGKATRPVIKTVSAATVNLGGTLTITTDGAVGTASLIRYGSVTHTINTDQRRIPLSLTSTGTNTYTVTIPTDPGVALPGYWMLFVLNSNGVPSVAKTVKVNLA